MSRLSPLLVLFLVCAAPVTASWLLWFTPEWRPATSAGHGELISPPRALPSLGDSSGQWTLALAMAPCGPRCESATELLDRIRRAVGYPESEQVRVALLTGGELPDRPEVLLVDPQGRAMMSYRMPLQPKGVLADLERVLKATQNWR